MNAFVKKIWQWIKDRSIFVAVVATIYLVAGIIWIILWDERAPIGDVAIPWDWVWLTVVAVYTFSSLKIVREYETGVLVFWGKPGQNVESGLRLVPFGIYTLPRFEKDVVELEFPGEPNQIWRMDGPDGKELPPGIGPNGERVSPPTSVVDGRALEWVSPLRITTASRESCGLKTEFPPFKGSGPDKEAAYEMAKEQHAKEEEELKESLETTLSSDPQHDRLTTEPKIVVRFRIEDASQFVQTIRSMGKAERQIEDIVIGRVQKEFGRRTPALIIANLDIIDRRLLSDVEIRVGEKVDPTTGEKRSPWGIVVEDVYVKTLGITETVNRAVAKRMAAGFKSEEVRLEGEGRGKARKAELEGEAAGLEKISRMAQSPNGRAALTAIYGERIAAKVGTLIVTDSKPLAEIGAALAAGRNLLQAPSASATPPTPSPTEP